MSYAPNAMCGVQADVVVGRYLLGTLQEWFVKGLFMQAVSGTKKIMTQLALFFVVAFGSSKFSVNDCSWARGLRNCSETAKVDAIKICFWTCCGKCKNHFTRKSL